MKKVFLLLAEGYEEVEALTVVDILRRGNVDVTIMSTNYKLGIIGAHNINVIVDMSFNKEALLQGDMIILPGGGTGTQNLKDNKDVIDALKDYSAKDKYIAAICAAPSVLGVNGLLKGKTAVCYPGFESQLEGAVIGTDPVVIDGKIITSKGPGTAMEFALVLLSILKGVEVSQNVKSGLLY